MRDPERERDNVSLCTDEKKNISMVEKLFNQSVYDAAHKCILMRSNALILKEFDLIKHRAAINIDC